MAARKEGVLSLFRGLGALLMKQIPYTSVKQVSFDLIARGLYSLSARLHGESAVPHGEVITLTSAFLTSILSCLASQPGDMVLTTMCQSSHENLRSANTYAHVHSSACDIAGCRQDYDTIDVASGSRMKLSLEHLADKPSAWQTATSIYTSRGLGGFFIGTQARLLHVVAIVTSQLVIYDAVKRLLGLAATGSH
jgi:hypothetical protein